MITLLAIWILVLPAVICLAAVVWRRVERQRAARRRLMQPPDLVAPVTALDERRTTGDVHA